MTLHLEGETVAFLAHPLLSLAALTIATNDHTRTRHPGLPTHSPVAGGARDIASHMAKHLVLRGCNFSTLDGLSTGHRNAPPNRAFMPGYLAEWSALDALFSSCAFDASSLHK